MIQGILIGMGAGYAIYSLVSWLAGSFISGKGAERRRAEEVALENQSALPDSMVGSEKETSVGKACRSEAPLKEKAVGVPGPGPDEPSVEEVPNLVESQTSGEVPDEKRWFLVRSAKGYLRATLLRAKTPKAVAGPFPTKTEALRAKELYDSTNGRAGSPTLQ